MESHMLQPPGSSKWDVSKEAIISQCPPKVDFEMNSPGLFALRGYSYKNEFCIVFARTFLDVNVT